MKYSQDDILKPYRLEGETYEEYKDRRKKSKKLLKLHFQRGYKTKKP